MKILIGAIIGGALMLAVFFFMNQPEPTPEERLEEAAQEAGEAAKDALGALKDVANEATETIAEDLSTSAEEIASQLETASDDLATRISSSSAEVQAALDQMMSDWKAAGILTDEGIDFDKANDAIASSELPDEAKSQLALVLNFLESAPGTFDARVKEVEGALHE